MKTLQLKSPASEQGTSVEECEQLLLDYREQPIVAVDLVGRPPGQQFLADKGQFLALYILKRKLLNHRERSAAEPQPNAGGTNRGLPGLLGFPLSVTSVRLAALSRLESPCRDNLSIASH